MVELSECGKRLFDISSTNAATKPSPAEMFGNMVNLIVVNGMPSLPTNQVNKTKKKIVDFLSDIINALYEDQKPTEPSFI